MSQPPVLAVLAGLFFIAVSYWWLRVDGRGPDNDASRHLSYAYKYFGDMQDGHVFSWFTAFDPGFAYPPLVHLVGALSLVPIGKVDMETAIFGINVAFVPMLVAGAYGVGSIAGDRRTGLLAVLVALGTPMALSMFHSFMIDGALAAVTALSVWLILRSDRFASWRWSGAAGLAVGLGLLTKSPFVFFVAGLLLVVLARGGWRNWRNVLVFAGAAALIALPWYIVHFNEISSHTRAVASFETPTPQRADSPYPERWTLDNWLWYGWNALNGQAYLPLVLIFLIGSVASTRRLIRDWRARGWRRGPPPRDVTPELLAGGIVGYLGISYLGLDDPRYSLPLLVYCAVLATAWLAHAKRTVSVAMSVAVVAIVAANTAVLGLGWGPNEPQRFRVLDIHSGSQIHRGKVTLLGPGYVAGPPDTGAELPTIFGHAKVDGVQRVAFGGRYFGSLYFGAGNIMFVVHEAGLAAGGNIAALGADEMLMYQTGWPEPGSCSRSETEPIYFNFRRGGEDRLPWYEYPPYCPL